MPRVSVIIPTYNCERFLKQTVDSALAQTYREHEVIVVDDGSTDRTPALMATYDQTVRYIRQSNQGASAARNLGVAHSTGEFIAYLDADDVWMPHKLEQQVKFLDAHPRCGLVHSEVAVIDEQNQVLHQRFNAETGRQVPQGQCIRDLLERAHIQTLTVVERRAAFDQAGEFDRRLPVAQDYLHWISVALTGWEIGYIAEPLGQYRWRKGSLMASPKRLLEDYARIGEILLRERGIEQSMGAETADRVRTQVFRTHRQLAYLERQEGSIQAARGRLLTLLQAQPLCWSLYLDLLKTFVCRSAVRSSTAS